MLLLRCNFYLSGLRLTQKILLNCKKERKRMTWESCVTRTTLNQMKEDKTKMITTHWTVAPRCCWKRRFRVCSWPCTGTRTRSARPSLDWCPPPASRRGASWSRWGRCRCRSGSRSLSRRNWGKEDATGVRTPNHVLFLHFSSRLLLIYSQLTDLCKTFSTLQSELLQETYRGLGLSCYVGISDG